MNLFASSSEFDKKTPVFWQARSKFNCFRNHQIMILPFRLFEYHLKKYLKNPLQALYLLDNLLADEINSLLWESLSSKTGMV